MSLASDYVAALAAEQTIAPPSPFIGPNGRAEVTAAGNMRLVQTSQGGFEVSPVGALAFAAWVTATFG